MNTEFNDRLSFIDIFMHIVYLKFNLTKKKYTFNKTKLKQKAKYCKV